LSGFYILSHNHTLHFLFFFDLLGARVFGRRENLQNWKKTFLANAEIAMEPSKAVKEYKEELVKSQKQNDGYLFKHLCAVIFDGLLSVVCPWFVIQATSINTQSLALLINQQKRRHAIVKRWT
jgi:hypothetical protein